MKNVYKKSVYFIAILVIFMAKTVSASVTDLKWFSWTLNTSTQEITITQFLYSAGNSPAQIVIPATITVPPDDPRYPAFWNQTFPVVAIGNGAFTSCGLSQVVFEAGSVIRTIGNNAFRSNQFTTIALPATVVSLGNGMFRDCQGLLSIDLSHLSITSLPSEIFYQCSKLASVLLPNGLESILTNAFYLCNALTYIKIPATVHTIKGQLTFSGLPVGSIIDLTSHQPASLLYTEVIGNNWWGCQDVTIRWHPDGYNNSSIFIFNKATGVIAGIKEGYLPASGPPPTSPPYTNPASPPVSLPNNPPSSYFIHSPVTIPTSIDGFPVTAIAEGAFGYRPARLVIRDKVIFAPGSTMTVVPYGAFWRCQLTEIAVPENLEHIERRVFYNAPWITDIILPETFQTIGFEAFYNNTRLKTVRFLGDQVTFIDTAAFNLSNAVEHIYLEEMDKGSVADAAQKNWGALYSIIHWKNGKTPPPIATDDSGMWRFLPATGVITQYLGPTGGSVTVNVPGTLYLYGTPFPITTVGQGAGSRIMPQNSIIGKVTIADGIQIIEWGAFNTVKIASLDLGNTLKEIRRNSFQACELTSLKLPESVTFIGMDAFADNFLSGEIIIPRNVASIDGLAFRNNPSIIRFLIYQNRFATSGGNGYTLSPQNVQSNAPFGALNAASQVFYMDDVIPVPTHTVTVNTTNNTAIIQLSVRLSGSLVDIIDVVPFRDFVANMPNVTNVNIVPWSGSQVSRATADMVINLTPGFLSGNNTYSFQIEFGNGRIYTYDVPIDLFRTITFHGNMQTGGTPPVFTGTVDNNGLYVQGYALMMPGNNGMVRHDIGYTLPHDFLGWTEVPNPAVIKLKSEEFPLNIVREGQFFVFGASNANLYAVWGEAPFPGGYNYTFKIISFSGLGSIVTPAHIEWMDESDENRKAYQPNHSHPNISVPSYPADYSAPVWYNSANYNASTNTFTGAPWNFDTDLVETDGSTVLVAFDNVAFDHNSAVRTLNHGTTALHPAAQMFGTVLVKGNFSLTGVLPSIAVSRNLTYNSIIASMATITSAASNRHFNITGGTVNLTFNNVTLYGNRPADGGGILISVAGANVTLNNAKIQNCQMTGNPDGTVNNENGGGICSLGSLILNNCVITGNEAASPGAANGFGGGVYAIGTLEINGGLINSNSAANSGGGIRSGNTTANAVKITSGEISGNWTYRTTNGAGGGVSISHNTGKLTLSGTARIINNGRDSGGTVRTLTGGGIFAYGMVEMLGGEVSGNTAVDHGGGIYCSNNTVNAIVISGGIVSGNWTTGDGGGIYISNVTGKLTVSGNAQITGNGISGITGAPTTNIGGGIAVFGLLAVEGGTISGNAARAQGGGISSTNGTANAVVISGGTVTGNWTTGATSRGGGIYIGNATGKLTVSGNAQITNNGINGSGVTTTINGGGIYASGTLEITGGTISGNKVTMQGGGIFMTNLNNLTVATGVTFSGNTANLPYWLELTDPDTHEYNPGTPITAAALKALMLVPNNVTNPANIPLSSPPAPNLPFLYAYNNYDINYIGTANSKFPAYEIWNWADLAYINTLIATNQLTNYEKYVLMQDLGVPGQNNSGNGAGCQYLYPRNQGWYGYQNWITDVGFNNTVTTNTLEVGGNTIPLTTIPQAWNTTGWIQIGTFTAEFDGNNKTINGLWIDRTTSFQALFTSVGNNATIKDFTLKLDARGITGGSYTGSVAGRVSGSNATIKNVASLGNVNTAADYTGGFIAEVSGENVHIIDCSYEGTVTVTGSRLHAGGFIANVSGNNAKIERSYSKCTVNATVTRWVGGFIGRLWITGTGSSGSVNQCYSVVKRNYPAVDANNSGSFLGGWDSRNVTVTDCYVLATIGYAAGEQYFDGAAASANAVRCYSIGDVGLYNSSNSYCNSEILVVPKGSGGTGLSTAAMSSALTFTGWNINSGGGAWAIDEGATYPYLKWQKNRPGKSDTYQVSEVTYSLAGGPAIPYYGPSVTLNNTAGQNVVFTVTNTDADRIYSPYGADVQFSGGTATITIPLTKANQSVSIGFASQSDIINLIAPKPDEIEVDITLFLQGVTQAGPIMTTYLQGPPRYPGLVPDKVLPKKAPFTNMPEFYNQINEDSGPAGKVVDWVLVEIMTNFESFTLDGIQYTYYDLLESRALLLKPDGSVVDTNGNKPLFQPYSSEKVRIAIKTRNHLSVISSELLDFDSDVKYDFSENVTKALKLSWASYSAMIEKNGVACLYGGDVWNGLPTDRTVNIINAVDIDRYNNKTLSTWALGDYMFEDINMDAMIDSGDGTYIITNGRQIIQSPLLYFIKR